MGKEKGKNKGGKKYREREIKKNGEKGCCRPERERFELHADIVKEISIEAICDDFPSGSFLVARSPPP